MNNVILIGRLTSDPEVRYTQGENPTAVASYTLAVDRYNSDADFIRCKAFGKNAEFAEKYLSKGTKIAVVGSIKTGSYTNKDNVKVYTTEVIVDRHEFCESKGASSGESTPEPAKDDQFMKIPDGLEELPFA